ncbi:MAG TPA: alpha/beta hydrolase [Steroidobacteraceae bacterium]|nr:alpha/beta hydrolase [Steroidobacteraceae bacterium]
MTDCVNRQTVVYVHGLWHMGPESLLLLHRLERWFGFDVRAFRYPSVSGSMQSVCAGLAQLVRGIDAPVVHFLGYSLGGLIVHRYLAETPPPQPGRVVFLGSPVAGSAAAVAAARRPWARTLLGRLVAQELLVARERRWTLARPLGLIAGTRGPGLGSLFAHFGEANDGVVAVSETRLPGATDHITLPATHLGLVLSGRVARQVGVFLREGHFALAP